MSPSVLHKSHCTGQHVTVTGKTALDIETDLRFRTKEWLDKREKKLCAQ